MRHDAIVIGGSFAGLAAATYIARARRSVVVIDTGLPRNRFAEHSHGFLAHDGSSPQAILATARSQLAKYPTVTFIHGEATNARQADGGLVVTLATGEILDGVRLVLAFGISDELPAIPGLAQRWGTSVLHCPYCHGYEFSGHRLGVLYLTPKSIMQSALIAEWGPTTLFLNGSAEPDAVALSDLAKRGVTIERTPVEALQGEGARLSSIELADGRTRALDALYIGPRTHLNSAIPEQLGCELEETALGPIIRVDAERMTTVPGVYAAGDVTRGAHTVTWAAADGVTAGLAVHRSLVF